MGPKSRAKKPRQSETGRASSQDDARWRLGYIVAQSREEENVKGGQLRSALLGWLR